MVTFLNSAPLTPALSPRWGERAFYQGSFFIPSPPMGERVKVRGNRLSLINPTDYYVTKY
jgi:hypothetical protein